MKSTYRIVGESGRVYIPKSVRISAGIGSGDVLELRAGKDKITLTKVRIEAPAPLTTGEILEMLDAAPKSVLFEAAANLTAILGGDYDAETE